MHPRPDAHVEMDEWMNGWIIRLPISHFTELAEFEFSGSG
jgi:hypothetical protein